MTARFISRNFLRSIGEYQKVFLAKPRQLPIVTQCNTMVNYNFDENVIQVLWNLVLFLLSLNKLIRIFNICYVKINIKNILNR